jgi:hypothetical protein
METIYLWPDRPALSLLAFWAISSIALWAARDAMRELFERLGKSLEAAFGGAGRWCKGAAEALHERAREAQLASGGLELQGKLEKEFPRIETAFSERLGQYSILHRKLDEILQRLEQDYQDSGISPPEVPGWTTAVESMAGIPNADDPNVKEILAGVQRSLDEALRQALHAYRADAAERHAILDRMRSIWKEVRGALEQTDESVMGAVSTASRMNAYIDEYSRLRDGDHVAARVLSYSAAKRFAIALFALAAAGCGAYASFGLLAPALAALLPEGAALGGVPAAGLAASAVIALEVLLGALATDLLGVTELLPRLGRFTARQRRLLLGGALANLFLLAVAGAVLAQPGLLGFVFPWLLALVAVPLETGLDSGRHVAMRASALLVSGLGSLAFLVGRTARTVADVLPSLYDAYVSIPLRIERAVKDAPSRRRVVDSRIKAREEVAT